MKDFILVSQSNRFGTALTESFDTQEKAERKRAEVVLQGDNDPMVIYKNSTKKIIWEGDSPYLEFYIKNFNLIR